MRVQAVHRSPVHRFSKDPVEEITLLEGLGVEGDAHAGESMMHRSRRWRVSPNLRQVHLLHSELLSALEVPPGDLGENVTTAGIDLLSLSTGTRLRLGSDAVVELTGLRNPCKQIERYQEGLLAKVLLREEDGSVTRLMGVMAVVLRGGAVRAGDAIAVEAPAEHLPLAVV